MTVYTGLLIITIMIVITQTITTWQVFHGFSTIENKALRLIQSTIFCSIISGTILIFVIKGITWVAFGAAILEVMINTYSYAKDFWLRGLPTFQGTKEEVKIKRHKSIWRFWRKYWLKMVFGVVIPGFIYLCSHYIAKEGV